MSRYISKYSSDHLFFTDKEWDRFFEVIQTNCKFYVSEYSREKDISKHFLCDSPITLNYYLDRNDRKFLISNDDRRKIVKYLRSDST